MTWPVTPDPGIHNSPTTTSGLSALNGLAGLRGFILQIPLMIIEAILAAITGIVDSIPFVGPLLAGPLGSIQNIFTNLISGLLGVPNPSSLNTSTSTFSASSVLSGVDHIPILGPLVSSWTSFLSGGTTSTNSLSSLNSLLANIPLIGPLLAGLTGSSSTGGGGLSALTRVFTDVFGLLGNPTGLGTGSPTLTSTLSDIPLIGPLFSTLLGFLSGGTTTTGGTTQLTTLLGNLPLIGPLLQGLTGSSTTGGGGITGLISVLAGLPQSIINGIASAFGVTLPGPSGNVLTDVENAALSMMSAIPGLNLFGAIRPQIAPVVSAAHVGTVNPELLWDPGFDTSGTVSPHSPQITWDGTVGRTGLGALKIQPDGKYVYSDVSNPIPVTPGDQLTLTVWTKWSSLTYTGTGPIRLEVLQYKEKGLTTPLRVASAAVQGIQTPPASQATWQELTGTFTVPNDGSVDTVFCRPLVDSTATAGSVWFDDASVQKTGLISHANVASSSGLATIGDDITSTVNTVIQAVTGGGSPGFGGIFEEMFSPLASLFSLGQTTAQMTNSNANTLAIQNNKPLHNSLNQTAAVSMSVDSLGTASTPANFALTSANAAMAFLSIPQAALNGAIGWHGSGTTGLTGFYVGVYKYDGSANINFVFESANIVGSVSNAWGWNAYTLPTSIQVQPGEIYGIYFRVTGSGTYSIAGLSQPWMQPYGSFPTHRGATISAVPVPSSIAIGSVVYSTNIPFAEFAVSISVIPVTTMSPVTTTFTTNDTFDIPTWSVYLDVIGIGSGKGGGGGSTWGIGGGGGYPGSWNAVTLQRGVDIPWTTTTLTVTVPAGGAAGAGGEVGGAGGNGSAATVTGTGWAGFSAAGGSGVSGYIYGVAPGNETYLGTTYLGGAANGGSPGAGGLGGGGGYPYLPGGNGTPGGNAQVWIVARQT